MGRVTPRPSDIIKSQKRDIEKLIEELARVRSLNEALKASHKELQETVWKLSRSPQ